MRRAIFLCLPLLTPPALAVECSTIAGNLVTNCGFSSGTTGWTPLGFTGFTTIGAAGENGTTAGHIDSGQDFFAAIQSSCIPVSPGASFDLGYAAKRSTPGGLEVRCIVSLQEFSDAGCLNLSMSFGSFPAVILTASAYSQLTFLHTVSSNAHSLALVLSCSNPNLPGIEALLDNAFVAPAAVVEVPAASRFGLLVLAMALLAGGWIALRARGA